MLYAVEGVDNSGKSVFAQRLAHELKAVYVKHHARPANDKDCAHYYSHVASMAECYDVVADRLMVVSEPIYGAVLRGKVTLTPPVCEAVLHVVDVLVYCRPPAEVIFAENDREQLDGVRENHELILELYDTYFERGEFPCPVLIYDWTRASFENTVKLLRLATEKHSSTTQ
jgi:hypothetical protein